jgi:hypothetical protein
MPGRDNVETVAQEQLQDVIWELRHAERATAWEILGAAN